MEFTCPDWFNARCEFSNNNHSIHVNVNFNNKYTIKFSQFSSRSFCKRITQTLRIFIVFHLWKEIHVHTWMCTSFEVHFEWWFVLLIKSTGPLHIPAKRPGFDADPSVIRHPHPWSSYESAAGYDTQYHSQYILDRDRKPLYYGYPDPQFSQVIFYFFQGNHFTFTFFLKFFYSFQIKKIVEKNFFFWKIVCNFIFLCNK